MYFKKCDKTNYFNDICINHHKMTYIDAKGLSDHYL